MNLQTNQQSSYALCRKPAAKTPSFFIISISLVLVLLSFFVINTSVFADDRAKTIEQILQMKKTPAGVVIEIVTWDGANLEWALPRSQEYIKQLREKFPKLSVAIVTHGAEQFALTNDQKDDNKEVHSLVQSLGKSDVPVHVCETFAGWRGLSSDDFPSYVNVAAAGPAQVNDYISVGYELIVISEE